MSEISDLLEMARDLRPYIEQAAAQQPIPEQTAEERISALEAENKLLKEQVSAQSDQMDFYEDCIAEMATVVYA